MQKNYSVLKFKFSSFIRAVFWIVEPSSENNVKFSSFTDQERKEVDFSQKQMEDGKW